MVTPWTTLDWTKMDDSSFDLFAGPVQAVTSGDDVKGAGGGMVTPWTPHDWQRWMSPPKKLPVSDSCFSYNLSVQTH